MKSKGRAHLGESAGSRRAFLAASLALAGGALARSLMAAETSRRLKLGFLGLGHSHFKEKLKVIQESPDWELVGLSEGDATLRAKVPGDARRLSEAQLFAEAEVVVIESEVRQHAPAAKRALLAGRHVHVEKPPADTFEGLRQLLRLAAERQRLVQVGYMWRHHPGINAALTAARQGWLGEVYLVRASINTQAGSEQRAGWAEFRGGMMFELGCHLIDPMVRLLGKPRKVTSHLQRRSAGDRLADNTVAVFEFNQAMGIITSAPLQPNAGMHRVFEVLGTNGTARVQPLEPGSLMVNLAKPAGPYSSGRQEVASLPYRRYVGEFAELADAIRRQRALPVSAEEELNVHDALLRACEMR